MKINGWDDCYLWACMMIEGLAVNYVDEDLYVHYEHENNASINWHNMAESGRNFMDLFRKHPNFKIEFSPLFNCLVENKIKKYDNYGYLDQLMSNPIYEIIEIFFKSRDIKHIAIYGIGIYGRKLVDILQQTFVFVDYGIDKNWI